MLKHFQHQSIYFFRFFKSHKYCIRKKTVNIFHVQYFCDHSFIGLDAKIKYLYFVSAFNDAEYISQHLKIFFNSGTCKNIE